jgi:hypothetical protein
MRTMYDSITAGDIPTSAAMVAGYVSGRYAWSAADWARFPGAVKVRIATQASVNDGVVLDVEPGDATPQQAPGWVQMRRAAGVDPTIYCNLTQLPVVQAAFTAAGVAQPHYWVARYDGVANLPAGCVAKQYADPKTSGGHWDLSAVADFWPGVDQVAHGSAATGGAPTTSTTTIPMEEVMKDIPAGNGVQTRLFAAGRPHYLWLQVSGQGNKVTVDDIAYIKRTNAAKTDGDYGPLGQPGYPDLRGKAFDADRPGPIQFADDVAWVWLKTTSTVDSSAAIG